MITSIVLFFVMVLVIGKVFDTHPPQQGSN